MSEIEFNEDQKSAIAAAVQWYKDLADGKKGTKKFFALGGYAGTGKCQPLDSIVETPQGRKTIGELTPGDYVIGRNGKPTMVVGVFPQGKKDVFRVTFRDGFSTRVGAEHLWTTISKNLIRKK